ncbi:MAG: hypothetical protein H6R18_1263 [Proteobacteria bacterium]|nr:hypothetical protein [Pseudomonadota bacterium]
MNDASSSLIEAAQTLASDSVSTYDAEVTLAEAIEHGQLAASIKRWATEQWEGRQLPGNLDRRQTFIARIDLEAWIKQRTCNP